MKTAIVSAASSFKGVFIHGVLDEFEKCGFTADAYSGASSMAIPSAYAAMGKMHELAGTEYWQVRVKGVKENNFAMSRCIKAGIAMNLPSMLDSLFGDQSARLLIGVSQVITEKAQEMTAREKETVRLARQLLVASARKDNAWAKENLAARVFDTKGKIPYKLTAENLEEVMYATTRLIPAWKAPALIEGVHYLDAIYTCGIPAFETASLGFEGMVVISAETGPLFAEMFSARPVPEKIGETTVWKIQPDFNLAEIGVEFMTATEEGLLKAYEHGLQKGHTFIKHSEYQLRHAKKPKIL